jgi:uncharacterized protein YbjT (DUF2867 family)
VNLDGTRRIIKILADRPAPPHVVYVSIVGCDCNPFRYYRAKYASELALERSKLPVTVVRATQFHTLGRSSRARSNHRPGGVGATRYVVPAVRPPLGR